MNSAFPFRSAFPFPRRPVCPSPSVCLSSVCPPPFPRPPNSPPTRSARQIGRLVVMKPLFVRVRPTLWLLAAIVSLHFNVMRVAQAAPPAGGGTPPESAQAGESADPRPGGPKSVPMVGHWASCRFGGDGAVTQEGTSILLEIGDPLTGVRWTGPLPATNDYQVSFQTRRTEGFDFFGALTFPVGDGYATLVPGGWGGGVFGISCINQHDASDNETTQYVELNSDRWYEFTVRVTDSDVLVWVDGKQTIRVSRAGKTFSLRAEMDVCQPLGIAAFQSDCEIRNVMMQTFQPGHPPDVPKVADDAQ